jgi:hypothetical protein
MKIVFKIILLAALLAGAPRVAAAQGVYFTTSDLLRDFFHDSGKVTYKKVEIGAKERERLMRRLVYAPARTSYNFFVAMTGPKIDGYALIDEQPGEHLPITFAVKLSPDGVVVRQEIVVYREPRGDEVRDARFRQQFVGKTAHDPIAADRDIVAVSGATISSRAMALGVKRAVVLFDELVRGQLMTAAASSPSPGL